MEKVALFAGGFKPAHKIHFHNLKMLCKQADKLVVFVGPKIREGNTITQNQARRILEIYGKYLDKPVEIVESKKSPVPDIYRWAEENGEKCSEVITGTIKAEHRRYEYFKNNKERYPNVKVLEIETITEGAEKVSASKIRNSKERLEKGDWVPEELNKKDKEEVIRISMENIVNKGKIDTDLENTLNKIKESELPKPKEIEEDFRDPEGQSSSITSSPKSEDRAKLAELYYKLMEDVNTDEYTINFNQDGIFIKLKDQTKSYSYDYTPYMASILEYMIEEGYNIQPLPEVKIRTDISESSSFFGRTAYYQPQDKELVLYVAGRHPKDVMRSFTHEMIHHMQNLENRIGETNTTDTNKDNALQKLEEEAYLKGNIIFRNWSDGIQNSQKNSKQEPN